MRRFYLNFVKILIFFSKTKDVGSGGRGRGGGPTAAAQLAAARRSPFRQRQDALPHRSSARPERHQLRHRTQRENRSALSLFPLFMCVHVEPNYEILY